MFGVREVGPLGEHTALDHEEVEDGLRKSGNPWGVEEVRKFLVDLTVDEKRPSPWVPGVGVGVRDYSH